VRVKNLDRRDQDKAQTPAEEGLRQRESDVAHREVAVGRREEAADRREESLRDDEESRSASRGRDSDLREANQSLVVATLHADELREAADVARQHQEEFLAMLAHELRNPLAPITNALALLAKPDASGATHSRMHGVIERQVAQMVRLVDDLLDVSRVTHGRVVLQRRATDVREVVQLALETVRPLLLTRHQPLTLDLPAAPLLVDGDPARLVQIVGNLLHNAAKYTPEGGAIGVSALQVGERVELKVSDAGIGIPAEILPRIFNLFAQDHRALDRSEGGLGIGLTIARRMVELHGGTIEARSGGAGQGSEFIVSLPAAVPADVPAVEPALSAPSAKTAAHIVLIEDNSDSADALSEILRLAGHRVDVAPDGVAGLEMVLRAHPQLVLCDIGVPGLDGYQIATKVRASGLEPMPVLIALTGYGDAAARSRSRASGFQHHLVKPMDIDALLALIDEALRPAAPGPA
jgi:signal transduction histidine kinase/ActR/RegA family two-component response regulator